MIATSDNCNFLSNIEFLLGKQDKHPWGKQIGLSTGTVSRMFQGKIPGHEVLNAISKYENASITWMVTGETSPYLITTLIDDEELAEHLNELLDQDWKISILNGKTKQSVIVLSKPAQYQINNKIIDYTAIEVMSGPLGKLTYNKLLDVEKVCVLEDIDEVTLTRIIRGQVGTRGILELINNTNCLYKIIERRATERVSENVMSYQTLDEKHFIEKFRALKDDDQKTIINLMDSLLNK
ncbi:MAG: hypothetical protein OEY11_12210 [Gammaproteobacteria bacterium]|nr:hypothetical protein [Gammaproteobacteria bacterium]